MTHHINFLFLFDSLSLLNWFSQHLFSSNIGGVDPTTHGPQVLCKHSLKRKIKRRQVAIDAFSCSDLFFFFFQKRWPPNRYIKGAPFPHLNLRQLLSKHFFDVVSGQNSGKFHGLKQKCINKQTQYVNELLNHAIMLIRNLCNLLVWFSISSFSCQLFVFHV